MRRIVTVSIGLLLLVGCGSSTSSGGVSGKITYKNEPVNGATLMLYSTDGKGDGIPLPVAQDGTYGGDVPVGDYKVVVQPGAGNKGPSTKDMKPEELAKMKDQIEKLKAPPTIPIPPKYTKKETTDLTMTVGKGSQTVPLELK